MHRFLVSAAHKSSGKTTVSIGLAAALRDRGLAVQTFKKGPDYIDPMWLALASGRPCRNLDPWLTDEAEIRAAFARHAAGTDVALVEGNKGLYDGLALDGSNSNAALAKTLDLPVVLVIDARGMTRGIAPLILGYQAFDRDIRIAGVILNQLGGSRHEAKLRAVIEHYTDVPVLGAIHHDVRLTIVERHLGLMPCSEAGDADRRIAAIGATVAAQVDLDRLLTVASRVQPFPGVTEFTSMVPPAAPTDVRIGIAQDRAFGFYYADDFDALRAAGATLVRVDTLADQELPERRRAFHRRRLSGAFRARAGGECRAARADPHRNRRRHAGLRRVRRAHVPCPLADARRAHVPDGRDDSRRRRHARAPGRTRLCRPRRDPGVSVAGGCARTAKCAHTSSITRASKICPPTPSSPTTSAAAMVSTAGTTASCGETSWRRSRTGAAPIGTRGRRALSASCAPATIIAKPHQRRQGRRAAGWRGAAFLIAGHP